MPHRIDKVSTERPSPPALKHGPTLGIAQIVCFLAKVTRNKLWQTASNHQIRPTKDTEKR